MLKGRPGWIFVPTKNPRWLRLVTILWLCSIYMVADKLICYWATQLYMYKNGIWMIVLKNPRWQSWLLICPHLFVCLFVQFRVLWDISTKYNLLELFSIARFLIETFRNVIYINVGEILSSCGRPSCLVFHVIACVCLPVFEMGHLSI